MITVVNIIICFLAGFIYETCFSRFFSVSCKQTYDLLLLQRRYVLFLSAPPCTSLKHNWRKAAGMWVHCVRIVAICDNEKQTRPRLTHASAASQYHSPNVITSCLKHRWTVRQVPVMFNTILLELFTSKYFSRTRLELYLSERTIPHHSLCTRHSTTRITTTTTAITDNMSSMNNEHKQKSDKIQKSCVKFLNLTY